MNITCPYDTSLCTLQTCSIECGQVRFVPNLPGNALFATIFGLLFVAQVFLGIRYRTWGFLVGMIFGLALEVVGYAGRIMLHNNPFDFNNFLLYLIPLTIGPAFLSGSIYLCLARIVVAYGTRISRLSPRTYTIVFMCCDFASLVLQGAGGGLAATADTESSNNAGRYIMIAGLATQVLSLAIFMFLWLEFIFRLRKSPESLRNPRFAQIRKNGKFKAFNYALWLATILIFVRSVYRIVELQGGFAGTVASNETAFMILEGPMVILAVLALTVIHPGRAFDGSWQAAGWSLRGRKLETDWNDSEENSTKLGAI